ncbi:3-oxoadipate enol-lactonase 2 [Variibacter gotjawalensis]|uniref:3-oxoadipate enol-lactonase 2 n=1 Tax=Variibacter gotjawalensis TaxID=1333996 RepID=A0A0S3PR26_9BRAD|nr:alpha/beta hydrolase [Variibacter gotjawalensis]NIK48634.1 proline iminopeptidase [Variibacter gotjawalensis]RZS50498.1 proline iminopeptidase [Variibacter gotjawalensis]BAT58332.1 3-oxoadipate enol-lactonase 2 [Variibacter gotjawalensis]
MPYAAAHDKTRLYYEEVGSGTPIIFVHEFAADYAGWEPQMRYFARGHRCIAYSARGYTPSETPSGETFHYENFRDDALAVLDHLKIDRAHFVGLSMGAYSSLQVGLHRPERAISLTLAGVGSGSSAETKHVEDFRKNSAHHAELYEREGAEYMANVYAESPNRISFAVKDPRGYQEFMAALARHDAQGSAHTQRGFQGKRPSIFDFKDKLQKLQVPTLIVCGDEDDACIEPSLFLKQSIPTSGLAMFPKTGHVLNLEEAALFNETVERFIKLAEAGRWPARDPRSKKPV